MEPPDTSVQNAGYAPGKQAACVQALGIQHLDQAGHQVVRRDEGEEHRGALAARGEWTTSRRVGSRSAVARILTS